MPSVLNERINAIDDDVKRMELQLSRLADGLTELAKATASLARVEEKQNAMNVAITQISIDLRDGLQRAHLRIDDVIRDQALIAGRVAELKTETNTTLSAMDHRLKTTEWLGRLLVGTVLTGVILAILASIGVHN